MSSISRARTPPVRLCLPSWALMDRVGLLWIKARRFAARGAARGVRLPPVPALAPIHRSGSEPSAGIGRLLIPRGSAPGPPPSVWDATGASSRHSVRRSRARLTTAVQTHKLDPVGNWTAVVRRAP